MAHNYLSVDCLHEDHYGCHPSRCFHCRQPCVCPCHFGPAAAALTTTEAAVKERERRTAYARALAGSQAV